MSISNTLWPCYVIYWCRAGGYLRTVNINILLLDKNTRYQLLWLRLFVFSSLAVISSVHVHVCLRQIKFNTYGNGMQENKRKYHTQHFQEQNNMWLRKYSKGRLEVLHILACRTNYHKTQKVETNVSAFSFIFCPEMKNAKNF